MEIYLKNLSCASCADKIEREIQNIDNIKKANVNFINKTLSIETDNGKYEDTIEEAKKIINRIEPDVGFEILSDEDELDESEDNSDKVEIIKMIISSILLIITIFLKDNYFTIAMVVGLVAYLVVGKDILSTAWNNILSGQVFDENFLMSIASIGAILIGEVTEGIAVMLLYSIGEFLQDKAVGSSTKSIKSLIKMKPEYGNLVVGEDLRRVNPKILEINDIIRVLPGEKIPVDSIIIKGKSSIDTSSITGESMPVFVDEGDEIISGSINKEGVLEARVLKSYKDSTVSQILDMVKNASSKKSKTENFITTFARYYTPIVVVLAILIALFPPIVLKQEFYHWIYIALTFLVISCPCAMVISIPLTYFAAIGVGSKNGILIKGSNYVDSMSQVNTIIFDKTGTLTKGEFKISNINVGKYDEKTIMQLAKKLEEHSNHPIAESIREYFTEDVDLNIENITEIPGRGMKGYYKNKEILLGNRKLLEENNITLNKDISIGTILYLSLDGEYIGSIEINDIVKEDSIESLKELKKLGVKNLIMLTGDRKEAAEYFARELGIDEYKSDLLPQDKVKEFEDIKNTYKGITAFVGDGTNDAPVLRLADIGISMGEFGSAAAIESSDVTIMGEKLNKIPLFLKISRKTKKIAIQNITFALGIKLIVMVLGVLGYANMWAAIFADVGVSLIAILNALRVMMINEDK